MARKKREDVKPKKKRKPVREVVEEDDEDEDDAPPPKKPSGNNAYTGLLVISLISLIAASVLLMLDAGDMKASPLSNPTVNVPALAAQPTAAPPTAGL